MATALCHPGAGVGVPKSVRIVKPGANQGNASAKHRANRSAQPFFTADTTEVETPMLASAAVSTVAERAQDAVRGIGEDDAGLNVGNRSDDSLYQPGFELTGGRTFWTSRPRTRTMPESGEGGQQHTADNERKARPAKPL